VKNNLPNKIRVLIVDDSYVSQKLFRHLLESDNRFEIIGFVNNGREAVEFLKNKTPDIISMDINMPLMDGMEATRQIMQTNPVPIVVASSLYDPSQQEMAMEALEAGAVAIMPKPYGPGHPLHEKSMKNWLQMIRSMSEVKVIRRRPHLKNSNLINANEDRPVINLSDFKNNDYRIVVIGASAGGPEGVKAILSKLTPSFPVPLLIVQHIDKHFNEGYRLWLQSSASIPVLAATENQPLLPGTAYLAPGEHHLVVKSEGMITLNNDLPVRGHRPSVAKLFDSAANVYGKSVIAVILSGMGSDGAKELKKLREMGALTFAQSKESCLVFGMPGEAVRMGAAIRINNPEDIAMDILDLFK
jgi:two-component system, chemotaxis family, protein-glutamate methylesterase/glutaminase